MTRLWSLFQAILFICVVVGLTATQAAQAGSKVTSERELSSWISAFYGRSSKSIPTPSPDCQVCFFEKPRFVGEKVCIGKRPESPRPYDSDVLPIAVPSTIGSIQFTSSATTAECALVANIRVLEPPYAQRIESFSSDTAVAGFDNTVQELFVEKSGTACFLAAKQVDQFGKCYNASIGKVEKPYKDAFYEVLLFKQQATDFDVIAYEGAHFNTNKCESKNGTTTTSTVAKPLLSKRFTASSGDLTIDLKESEASSIPNSLRYKINSIEFVRPGAPAATTTTSV